jgi:hypothetical protein
MALSDLQKMVAGMFYPAQPAANASIYDLARADAQRQSMSALGAGLIGAAVPQTPLMRAQALQSAFAGAGNMGTNVYNAAQARLMAQKAEADAQRSSAMANFFSQGAAPQTDSVAAVQAPVGEFRELPVAAARIMEPQPPTVNFPGGLNAQQWGAVQQAGSIDPDEGIKLYSALVKKNAGASEDGFTGSKNLVGAFDEKGTFFQTYVDINGNIVRPSGAEGNVRFATPQEINAQKAEGTATGRMAGETRGGAPAAITAADKTINLIDKILSDPALPNVVGDIQGRFDDPSFIKFNAGESGVATVNRINQLKAKGFIQAINSTDIKGALSDAEGMKLDSAETALSRVMSEESFREEMLAYRDIAERAKQRQALIEAGKTEAEARAEVPESPFVEGTTTTPPAASTGVPEGIDPEDWNFLSPEEKKLWQ